jgi:hypothetical protein
MSNIFKTNSRFAALIDDKIIDTNLKKNKKKVNNEEKTSENNKIKDDDKLFKQKYNTTPHRHDNKNNNFINKYSKENHEIIQKEKQLNENKKKDEILLKSIAIENFPDLVKTVKKEEPNEKLNISFIEKLNTEVAKKTNEKEDNDFVNLQPGWCLIKKDKMTNKTIMKIKLIQNFENKNLCDVLCDLHEKRTAEYIEMWGYDAWEKNFRSPTWDYEYFNKLDQEYEQETEKLGETEEDNEYITDYDKHNNYWKHY